MAFDQLQRGLAGDDGADTKGADGKTDSNGHRRHENETRIDHVGGHGIKHDQDRARAGDDTCRERHQPALDLRSLPGTGRRMAVCVTVPMAVAVAVSVTCLRRFDVAQSRPESLVEHVDADGGR